MEGDKEKLEMAAPRADGRGGCSFEKLIDRIVCRGSVDDVGSY